MTQDWLEEDDSCYVLDERDERLLGLVAGIVRNAIALAAIPWSTKATLAKLMHVYARLPHLSCQMALEVTFTTPRTSYGDAELYFSLTLAVESDTVRISYGGHYYHPRSGGDSFSVFDWQATPDDEPHRLRYDRSLGVVTALVDPRHVLDGMSGILDCCEIRVTDDDNLLLDDDPVSGPTALDDAATADTESDSEVDSPSSKGEDERREALVVRPVTAADRQLLQQLGSSALDTSNKGEFAYGIDRCDGCGVALSDTGLMVDGANALGGWGNYCAQCCIRQGVAVGWGKGQLYARQDDGTWALVAGFRR